MEVAAEILPPSSLLPVPQRLPNPAGSHKGEGLVRQPEFGPSKPEQGGGPGGSSGGPVTVGICENWELCVTA